MAWGRARALRAREEAERAALAATTGLPADALSEQAYRWASG